MTAKKCSECELYEIAEEILVEGRVLSDFTFLDDDDKAKVIVIIDRGIEALAEYQSKVEVSSKKTIARKKKVRRANQESYVYVSKKQKQAFVPRARKFGLKAFSLEVMLEETELIRRKFMETLTRKLSAQDIALLLNYLEPSQISQILTAVSKRLSEDIRFHITNTDMTEVSPLELEMIAAKYSITTSSFLAETKDTLLQTTISYLEDYISSFRQQVESYISDLPEKLGIQEILDSLNQEQWARLAGLTPRKQIAKLSIALKENYTEQLTAPLPFSQLEDVRQLISFEKKEREKDLSHYGDSIEALKQWLPILQKLVKDED